MSLRGQKTITLQAFEGKRTTGNLSAMSQDNFLRCDGVTRYGEAAIETASTPAPLTGFVAVPADGAIATIYDFNRSVDSQQFLIFGQGSKVKYVQPSNYAAQTTVLDVGGAGTDYWQFVQNNFILYGTDGILSYRFIDKAGVMTPYKWGIDPPLYPPSASTGTAGTNSLVHGRRYVYAYVSKYTDSLSIVRVSVGAASPISNYSGPTTLHNIAVPVTASTDPQVTHIWVFETFDAVDGTVNSYYFAAELTNTTQTFQDGLADAALDQSRQAPFENYPCPTGVVAVVMYQNHVVAVGKDFIQFSANGETSLGIDQENFPPSLFITLPAGSLQPTAAIVLNSNDPSRQSCWVGTPDAWYPISNIAVGSITMGDKIATPGPIAVRAASLTPTHMAWVGTDYRVWAWNGLTSYLSEVPAISLDISESVWTAIAGTPGMDSIRAGNIPYITELRWFSSGGKHFLILAAHAVQSGTSIQPYKLLNWLACWQIEVKGPQITAIKAFDIFPQSVSSVGNFNTTGLFSTGGIPMLLGGDGNGGIWDLLGTIGSASQPRISTTWLHDESNADCRWLFVDIETDQYQPEQKFTVLAVAAESPDMAKTTLNVRQIPDPRANAGNSTRFRCILEGSQGVSFGKYLRLEVLFPTGNTLVKLSKIEVAYMPTFMGTP